MSKRKLKSLNKIVSDVQKEKPRKKRKKGPKRHIRKSLIVVLAIAIVAGLLAWKVPTIMNEAKLKELGYSKEAISKIEEEQLSSKIIENGYYSKYLENSILDGSLKKKYISLYAHITTDRTLTNTDLLLYNRLLDKGYESDQLENLFNNLQFYEITPLLIFDYQWDENPYIEDCKNNRETNSETSFSLSDNYYTLYKLQYDCEDQSNTNVLVNSNFGLTSDYVPDNLVTVDSQYSVNDTQLKQEVNDALVSMITSAIQENHYFYATAGYRSYETQEAAYNSLLGSMSESEADKNGFRAGHSEHQTGLAVNVTATYETDKAFEETDTYKWILEHCTEYGFIQRYPQTKSSITGNADELDHFRYVGKDLAQKIVASNLTYDEYYELYLASWDEKDNIPSKSITSNISDYSVNN